MRTSIALALLGLFAATAYAAPADPKVLAQFDLGYVQCENRFPEMRGHRDEAYLALWRIKADAKTSAELDKVRKSDKYKKERQLAFKSLDKTTGPEVEAKLKRQCDATWAEVKRNGAAPKPVAASAPKAP
jgi:hypothetical protein